MLENKLIEICLFLDLPILGVDQSSLIGIIEGRHIPERQDITQMLIKMSIGI